MVPDRWGADGMSEFAMTINGEAVGSSMVFPVMNPASGESFASAPSCSRAQLDAAVRSAEHAFLSWRRDESLRRTLLQQAADRLTEATDDLAPILTQEQGKPLGQAVNELKAAWAWLEYYAALEMPDEVLQDDAQARVVLRRRPIGPVAAITPWNVPVALAFWKIAPALRAGNTVVVKPSPFTPLTTLRIGQILADVFPPGVLNVVSGPDPLGADLTQHPGIRKISFTGSTATGKRVAAAAALDLKRVTLELGGNDPAIVLDDADPEVVAAGVFRSAMVNSGQVCVAVKRVYVPRPMHDKVVEALVELANNAVVGNGMEPGVQYGPLNNRPQLELVEGLVEDALGSGARVAAGGGRPYAAGYFYSPTVLIDVHDRMPVVAEEQFGPVLPVVAYDSVDDAVAAANGSHFGLGSSVWTQDRERGVRVARQLDAGTTWVNTHTAILPSVPFGGVKWSGIGIENGIWGLHEYTDVHVIYEQADG